MERSIAAVLISEGSSGQAAGAAVDSDACAGHVRGQRRCQEGRHHGDLLGPAVASQGNFAQCLRPHRVGRLAGRRGLDLELLREPLRFDGTRVDHIDAHSPRAPRARKACRGENERSVGGATRDVGRLGDLAAHTDDVHHRTVSALGHAGHDGVHGQDRRQVLILDAGQPAPGITALRDVLARGSGGVDQDLDRSDGRLDLRDHGLDRVGVAQVGRFGVDVQAL